MARIPDAFIDDLLARTDIVEVVGSRVPLKRQGREYSARCPFHDERSPSFTVSPTKQFYHCFGCGAHGTAISFLMNYDRLEFLDAVEELAKRAGMEVPRDTRQRNESGESRELYAAVDAAAKFFQQQLRSSTKARAYLERRGVDAENQARFGIGYAPEGWEGLKSALGTDERRLALLEKVGLFSRNDAGRVYDKFRDRVMFPIHDRRGRVIAFGGRVLEKDDGPKYLNSPETPLFHKGRELYGLWQVRQAHSKIPRLVVVEGYMDVVALFQYGVNTAVATLGTATTPDHAELLFRNAADVYFCFDGDRAGRGAAWKALESVLPRMRDGRQAFFLFLPEGEDPDTIVRKEGAAGFDARLAQAMPLSEFFYNELSKDVNLAGMEGKARLAERAKPLLAGIPDGAFRDLMLQRLTELTGVGRREEATPPARPTPSMRPGRGGAPAPKRSLVRTAIALLLQKPALAEAIEPPYLFGALRQPGIPLLVELVQLAKDRPGITTGAVLEHFAGREEEAALQKLALQAFPGDEAGWRAEIVDALAQLDRQVRAQRVEELQARIREAGSASLSEAEKTELRDLLTAK
ncbi:MULTISPECIES: DNA primase [unclassified Arenimonas]|uniref:DNA primase n=1 Tax=unclassified Arenimonas TaxID=2641713 RepID=UPI00086CC0F0|nr:MULTISPECIES: DNA primase [unclassified Arenimonas]ODS61984.1 MAG: DNA primase [Arenimonas sp. SCN 70-307]